MQFLSILSVCASAFLALVSASLYSPASEVLVLDLDGVNNLKSKGQIYLVEYFADWCGHCQKFASEYSRAAAALKGVVTVVASNDDRAVEAEQIKGYPTVKLHIPGIGDEVYGGPRTAEDIVEFVTTRIQTSARRRLAPYPAAQNTGVYGGRVIPLNSKNFDRLVLQDRDHTWFVKFYAPWCGHCKSLAPAWTQLATQVPANVLIGEVDATVEQALAARYGVQSYPSLKVFTTTGAAVPYAGARDVNSLKNFVVGYSPSIRMLHMRNEEQFKELCETNTCFVAFLPHILDSSAAERKKYLKELSAVANESRDLPYKYFWVQGGDNTQLEEQLRLGFGWPALVAFKQANGKFAVHRGSFDSASIRPFVQRLSGASWQQLPGVLAPWPEMLPWDGKDAQPEVEEEGVSKTNAKSEEL